MPSHITSITKVFQANAKFLGVTQSFSERMQTHWNLPCYIFPPHNHVILVAPYNCDLIANMLMLSVKRPKRCSREFAVLPDCLCILQLFAIFLACSNHHTIIFHLQTIIDQNYIHCSLIKFFLLHPVKLKTIRACIK